MYVQGLKKKNGKKKVASMFRGIEIRILESIDLRTMK